MKRFVAFLAAIALCLAPVQAQMLLLGVGPDTFGIAATTCTFESSAFYNSSSTATMTFTAQGIGGPGLIVVYAQVAGGTRTFSAPTIGGVSATIIGQNNGTNMSDAIFAARVTSGVTATVAFTVNSGLSQAVIETYNLANVVSDTPFDSNLPVGGAQSSRTATLNIPANGCVVAGAINGAAVGSWTNATFNDTNGVAANFFASVASASTATLLSAQVITNTSARAVGAASWR